MSRFPFPLIQTSSTTAEEFFGNNAKYEIRLGVIQTLPANTGIQLLDVLIDGSWVPAYRLAADDSYCICPRLQLR